MKSLLLLSLLLFCDLSANVFNKTFYEIGSYEHMYEREVGKEKATKDIEAAKKDENFKKAYKELDTQVGIPDKETGKIIYPDFVQVLSNLKKSNKIFSKWTGLVLYTFVQNRINQKYMDEYGIYFADQLTKKNLCNGYLMKGIFMAKRGYQKEDIVKTFNNGMKNGCSGTDFEKFYLKVRKHEALRN